ncbi:MAG: copper chaperone PCu(A)C [Steroidobacteraceae bacterium]
MAAAAGSGDMHATGAWIRWLPAGLPSAGYLSLVNTGTASHVLVGALSADFAEVGIHQTRATGGMMKMAPVAAIVIEPHAELRFSDGGYHLMLMGPKRPLHPGDRVSITLRFGDGETMSVPFEVRAANAPP